MFCQKLLRYWNTLGPKNHVRKIKKKLAKVLKYIKSSCIIFCVKMFGYSHYIYILLRKRNNTFWPKGIDKFHSRGIQIFWALKIIEEYYFDTSKSFTDKSTKSIFTTTVNFLSILPNYYRHPPDFIIFQFYS